MWLRTGRTFALGRPELRTQQASPLSVAIDAHMVGTHETGNETYVVQLTSALARLGGYDYKLYTPRPQAIPSQIAASECVSIHSFGNVPAFVRIPWLYPRMVGEDGVGLLHMTYMAPPRLRCPLVLSIHDVSYKVYPQFFSPRVRLLLAMLVGPGIRRAARIVTISESSKRDIIRFYGVRPEKIVVTPLAAGSQYMPQPADEVARVLRSHNLSGRYVLAVGDKQPRKNLSRLVRAFSTIALEMPDVMLVIVGQSGWQGSEVGQTVKSLGLNTRVRFTGFVPDSDLPALYSGADVFCYPSLYEGFGLPPLEAMACGAPTVTSNTSSLPEVVGDAALTVDPLSVGEMVGALRNLLADSTKRQEYGRRALHQAALFSWDRTARLTRDAYDKITGVVR
jgi:glycosyltransferase involved in cell wall biosynthesis